MTFNRDKRNDKRLTESLIQSGRRVMFAEPSWLGHKGKGAVLDYELLKGATKEQLVLRSGRKRSAVDAHLYHLKKEHGITISSMYGVYKLDIEYRGLKESKEGHQNLSELNRDIESKEDVRMAINNDEFINNKIKIGQLVKNHIHKIFHYCQLEDQDELARLMDKNYSKRVFNINFPFCKELNQITSDELVRFWKIDYRIQKKMVRVCSQWYKESNGLFLAYLYSKNIISDKEYAKLKDYNIEQSFLNNPQDIAEPLKEMPPVLKKEPIHKQIKTPIIQMNEEESETFFDLELKLEAENMAKYYEIFYALERSIRNLIVDVMVKKYGEKWWETKVDYKVSENVKRNLEYELDTPHSKRSQHNIDYTTFGDLRKIINSNWRDFQFKFNRNLRSVNEILIDLNRIRVPIAHSTPLAQREVKRLEVRIEDWFDLLSK